MPNTTEDSAVLRVVVTTALGALPLADASVTVSTAPTCITVRMYHDTFASCNDVCSDGPPRPVSQSVSRSLRQRDG